MTTKQTRTQKRATAAIVADRKAMPFADQLVEWIGTHERSRVIAVNAYDNSADLGVYCAWGGGGGHHSHPVSEFYSSVAVDWTDDWESIVYLCAYCVEILRYRGVLREKGWHPTCAVCDETIPEHRVLAAQSRGTEARYCSEAHKAKAALRRARAVRASSCRRESH